MRNVIIEEKFVPEENDAVERARSTSNNFHLLRLIGQMNHKIHQRFLNLRRVLNHLVEHLSLSLFCYKLTSACWHQLCERLRVWELQVFLFRKRFCIVESSCHSEGYRSLYQIYRGPLQDCTFSCWHSFLGMDCVFPLNTSE